MPTNVTPRQIMQSSLEGLRRLKRYRRIRMMGLQRYVGSLYRSEKGITGKEPVNMTFNAIRAIVPHLVMQNPDNDVLTQFRDSKDYAFLLGQAINTVEERMKFSNLLRSLIVDAMMMMGIGKVGIAASGQWLDVGDMFIDPGTIYAERVDLDNFILDPDCTSWERARFMGDIIRVPRQELLDSLAYDSDLVLKLPKAGATPNHGSARNLSNKHLDDNTVASMYDMVEIAELFIPEANATVVIPHPEQAIFNDFISIRDFYGPQTGPYIRLSVTQPVGNNPIPVAPCALWADLHDMTNNSMVKSFDQMTRQKSNFLYDPAHVDTAEDLRDASDGEFIPCSDPQSVVEVSTSGQHPVYERWLGQCHSWFNYAAGNPDRLQGLASDANTATEAEIQMGNQTITMSDMKGMIYDCAAEFGSRIAWYIHTDPLLDVPLCIRRGGGEEVYIRLTPEQRRGDYLNFTFKIRPKSMNKLDAAVRAQRILQFATNIVPAAVNATMLAMQMGQPFNMMTYLTRMAEEMEIGDWVQDLFYDPEFENRVNFMMQMRPQDTGKGTATSNVPNSGMAGILQNGGFPQQSRILSPQGMSNQRAQMGAIPSQQILQSGVR